MLKQLSLSDAQAELGVGGVLAYPTESVYGLGCDPFNETAVRRLLALKKRAVTAGLILLVSSWDDVNALTKPLPEARLAAIKASWPGPVTWLFPKSDKVPEWISGQHDTIALRMSAHPVAQSLAQGQPLVSTSANVTGQPPAKTPEALARIFPTGIDGIVDGALGNRATPSDILDARTGQRIR